MALPLGMLKTLQTRTGQKIGLALLFLIATVGIVFDILHTIYNIREGLVEVETILWDILEPTIVVMISALPTYRALFGNYPRESRIYRRIEHAGNQTMNHGATNGYELSNTLISGSEPESRIMQ